jgi:hypothetical protein
MWIVNTGPSLKGAYGLCLDIIAYDRNSQAIVNCHMYMILKVVVASCGRQLSHPLPYSHSKLMVCSNGLKAVR